MNQIGDEVAIGLSQAYFPHLKDLKLWGNEIGDKGAVSLSRANFLFLQTLNLYNNHIGDCGASDYLNLTLSI
jgi:hypothetical protein